MHGCQSSRVGAVAAWRVPVPVLAGESGADEDVAEVQALLRKFYEYTGSERPWRMLQRWEEHRAKFVKVYPNDYRRVLETQKRVRDAGVSEADAEMAAFELNARDLARAGGK